MKNFLNRLCLLVLVIGLSIDANASNQLVKINPNEIQSISTQKLYGEEAISMRITARKSPQSPEFYFDIECSGNIGCKSLDEKLRENIYQKKSPIQISVGKDDLEQGNGMPILAKLVSNNGNTPSNKQQVLSLPSSIKKSPLSNVGPISVETLNISQPLTPSIIEMDNLGNCYTQNAETKLKIKTIKIGDNLRLGWSSFNGNKFNGPIVNYGGQSVLITSSTDPGFDFVTYPALDGTYYAKAYSDRDDHNHGGTNATLLTSPPLIVGDTVIFVKRTTINFYSLKSNTIINRVSAGANIRTEQFQFEPTVLKQGGLIIGTSSGELRYLSPENGTTLRTVPIPNNLTMTPIDIKDGSLISGRLNQLIFIDQLSGEFKKTLILDGRLAMQPTELKDGTIMVRTTEGHLYFVDPTNKIIKNRVETASGNISRPIELPDGNILAVSNNEVFIINPVQGKLIKKMKLPNTVNLHTPPQLFSDGTVVIGSERDLHFIDPKSATIVATHSLSDTIQYPPVELSPGKVVVSDKNGTIYSLEVQNETKTNKTKVDCPNSISSENCLLPLDEAAKPFCAIAKKYHTDEAIHFEISVKKPVSEFNLALNKIDQSALKSELNFLATEYSKLMSSLALDPSLNKLLDLNQKKILPSGKIAYELNKGTLLDSLIRSIELKKKALEKNIESILKKNIKSPTEFSLKMEKGRLTLILCMKDAPFACTSQNYNDPKGSVRLGKKPVEALNHPFTICRENGTPSGQYKRIIDGVSLTELSQKWVQTCDALDPAGTRVISDLKPDEIDEFCTPVAAFNLVVDPPKK